MREKTHHAQNGCQKVIQRNDRKVKWWCNKLNSETVYCSLHKYHMQHVRKQSGQRHAGSSLSSSLGPIANATDVPQP